MLVSGRRASRSSKTTSVLFSSVGSIRWNCSMCPGNHDGGAGSAGKGMCVSMADRHPCLAPSRSKNDRGRAAGDVSLSVGPGDENRLFKLS